MINFLGVTYITGAPIECDGYECEGEKGGCVPVSYLCNGKVECPAGDDESLCIKKQPDIGEIKENLGVFLLFSAINSMNGL